MRDCHTGSDYSLTSLNLLLNNMLSTKIQDRVGKMANQFGSHAVCAGALGSSSSISWSPEHRLELHCCPLMKFFLMKVYRLRPFPSGETHVLLKMYHFLFLLSHFSMWLKQNKAKQIKTILLHFLKNYYFELIHFPLPM